MDATVASCNLPRARMQRAAAAARMRSYGAHVRTATDTRGAQGTRRPKMSIPVGTVPTVRDIFSYGMSLCSLYNMSLPERTQFRA